MSQIGLWLELMFGKVCSGVVRGIRGRVDLSKMEIGRMTAETSNETVRKEFNEELRRIGWQNLREKIGDEQAALSELIDQQQKIRREVYEHCVAPALSRAEQGYQVRGFFWQRSQENLNKIVNQESLKNIEESIDWLNTRQQIFEELDSILDHFPASDQSLRC